MFGKVAFFLLCVSCSLEARGLDVIGTDIGARALCALNDYAPSYDGESLRDILLPRCIRPLRPWERE